MNAIAAVFYRDGRQPEGALMQSMASAAPRTAPARQSCWRGDSVGMTHGSTDSAAPPPSQPLTFDQQVWITADARLDARDDLRRALHTAVGAIPHDVTDEALLLYAYLHWGAACVDHLIGDFVFLIWDSRCQQLICARDHFGVRSLYYYVSDTLFVAASTFNALWCVPEVPRQLNEVRLGDYVVDELEGIDKTSTFFVDLYRLPPATLLVVTPADITQREYWQLEAQPTLHLPSDAAYVEVFQSQLTQAVTSRIRDVDPQQFAIMLSGGLDSTAIAAITCQAMNHDVITLSAVADDPDMDEETRRWSAVVQHLGVDPIALRPSDLASHRQALDDLLGKDNNLYLHQMLIPQLICSHAQKTGIPVLLTGVAGDDILRVHVPDRDASLAQKLIQLAKWVVPQPLQHIWRENRQQRDIRHTVNESGLHPAFIERHKLHDRLRKLQRSLSTRQVTDEGERYAHWLNHPYIAVGLERYAGVGAFYDVEFRHPYLDKRLVEFCASLPATQRRRQGWPKFILREAMHDHLPSAIIDTPEKVSVSYLFWETWLPMVAEAWQEPALPPQLTHVLAPQTIENASHDHYTAWLTQTMTAFVEAH